MKFFEKAHQSLSDKSAAYSGWHQKRYANKAHWGILIVFNIIVALVIGYYFSFYTQNKKGVEAGVLSRPRLSEPYDGNILKSKRPTLKWSAVSGANTYKVELYQDDLLVKSADVSATSYTPSFDLADKGNYYWRVKAQNLQTVKSEETNIVRNLFTGTVEAARRNKPKITLTFSVSPSSAGKVKDIKGTRIGRNVDCPTKCTYTTDLSNSTAVFQAFPSSGYVFSKWVSGTQTSTDNPINISKNASASWEAVFVTTGTPAPDPTPTPTPTPDPTPVTEPTKVLVSESVFSNYWNFSIDTLRTADFAMPDPNKKWLGAFATDTGDSVGAFKNFEQITGRDHEIAHKFKSFYWDAHFPASQAIGFYNSGNNFMVTWEPWDPGKGVDQPTYSNTALTTNKLFVNGSKATLNADDYYNTWAKEIKQYKKPIYLRLAHEMNGNWYPWGAANGNTPETYVAFWRHVHDIFEQNKVKNVKWVWCVNNDPASTIKSYYPGDNYVDVVAVDGYNFGNTKTWSSWTEFKYIFDKAYTEITSLTTKDFWITETSSQESGGSKASWVTNAYSYAKTNYPKITNIMWFNIGDWVVNSSTTSLNAYKQSIVGY